MNQVSKIIIIIIIIRIIRIKKTAKSNGMGEKRALERERERFFIFLFFSSLFFFLRSMEIGPWDLLEQEAKLVYATRATHGWQNLGVSSNSTR